MKTIEPSKNQLNLAKYLKELANQMEKGLIAYESFETRIDTDDVNKHYENRNQNHVWTGRGHFTFTYIDINQQEKFNGK